MESAGEEIEDEEIAAAISEKGIGTPATRADIIENLIAKGYLVRAGKSLRPTVKGIRLVDVLRRIKIDRLASASLTGELEYDLRRVERGSLKARQFMDEIVDYTKQIVDIAVSFQYEDLYPDEEPLGKCPLCSRPVFERSWFYRCLEVPGSDRGRRLPLPHLEGQVGPLHGPPDRAHPAREGRDRGARGLRGARRPHLQRAAHARGRRRRDPRRGRQRGRARDRGGRVRGRRRAARPLPDGLRHAGRRDPDPLPVPGGNREGGRERREGARVRGVAAEGAEEAQALQGAGRGQAVSVPAAAHGVQARDHARRGAAVHRPEQEDGAPDRLHLALRPPVLGDAVPEGERPPRLRVPAAPEEGRAGRARRRRCGAGCTAADGAEGPEGTQESAPAKRKGKAAPKTARRGARKAKAAEQPETRKAARRKT